ncbi:MAG: protein-export membrane protein SecD [Candidatus Ryanbacteria bacterium RIFCSPHIGHO2_02_FULL_45_17b]|uniref:Protein translocase subunit SecD n=1 Tax=Candidatus Ryanbacteria bacterium RIFCSPHIGHO2_01_FULL_45_22 TaxID=1802114 RepID=A0A1G2G1K3_9BACT|nr:MAG: protein-export membrane protein SecD [Candidatus Ryanbacteria bacterium RIFCSPHIGHO2_01_FULL_45_22]OGZ47091.1 MAG: protein-export membrane protein SecD [Candidatus Ryanbacteria bacterium RIFCSPHIGHO2_02_FULL_45_17b]
MPQSAKIRIIAVLLLVAGGFAGVFASPYTIIPFLPQVPYRLGLDLQGGTHLLYQADVSSIPSVDVAESMEGLRDVIERRVNAFGVSEPVVQIEEASGEQRLIVELAGVREISEAIRLIGETPFLEFRTERSAEERQAILDAQAKGERLGEDAYFIPTELTGKYLKRADVQYGQTGIQVLVTLSFDDEGSLLFENLTEQNIGKQLAIYLDGFPISAPVVQQKITGGQAQISGNFTVDEARELVRRLNSGALPVPITLVSQQSVEASLGQAELVRSLNAGAYGLLAVALFMILWYRLPGLMAVFALLLYTALLLVIFKLVPVTLTAAGVAGFILSIGMAVDANILIFERFREEMKAGRTLAGSIEEGFNRAWASIRDSNMSSIITAFILYWFGTSLIKGFALTLGLGVVVSMFSAITITRTFFRALKLPDGKITRFLFGA